MIHVGLLVRRFVSFGFGGWTRRPSGGLLCCFDTSLVLATTAHECHDDNDDELTNNVDTQKESAWLSYESSLSLTLSGESTSEACGNEAELRKAASALGTARCVELTPCATLKRPRSSGYTTCIC